MLKKSPLLSDIYKRLEDISETSRLDAQVLLAHILGKNRTWVLAHPEVTLTTEQQYELDKLLYRLESGVPLPYVIGYWEFYGLDFLITPETLIPRPETELMVETALAWLKNHPKQTWVADVGTGSGCVAVTLAKIDLNIKVLASDISLPALNVAHQNAVKHSVIERVHCIQSDLLPVSYNKFDLICANLPYIPSELLQTLRVYQREPNLALDGGPDGLSLIRQLLEFAPLSLAPHSLLLLEIESSTCNAAHLLAQKVFPQGKIQILADLAGKDRLISIERHTI